MKNLIFVLTLIVIPGIATANSASTYYQKGGAIIDQSHPYAYVFTEQNSRVSYAYWLSTISCPVSNIDGVPNSSWKVGGVVKNGRRVQTLCWANMGVAPGWVRIVSLTTKLDIMMPMSDFHEVMGN